MMKYGLQGCTFGPLFDVILWVHRSCPWDEYFWEIIVLEGGKEDTLIGRCRMLVECWYGQAQALHVSLFFYPPNSMDIP
jgi:hypothetical protein